MKFLAGMAVGAAIGAASTAVGITAARVYLASPSPVATAQANDTQAGIESALRVRAWTAQLADSAAAMPQVVKWSGRKHPDDAQPMGCGYIQTGAKRDYWYEWRGMRLAGSPSSGRNPDWLLAWDQYCAGTGPSR